MGVSVQQPKVHDSEPPHGGSPAPQRGWPSSQLGTGPVVPASPPPTPASVCGAVQSAGRSASVLPGHSSQRPQVLPQVVEGTHSTQFVRVAPSMLQLLPSSRLRVPVPTLTVQQPKQSQPFGVYCSQKDRHC